MTSFTFGASRSRFFLWLVVLAVRLAAGQAWAADDALSRQVMKVPAGVQVATNRVLTWEGLCTLLEVKKESKVFHEFCLEHGVREFSKRAGAFAGNGGILVNCRGDDVVMVGVRVAGSSVLLPFGLKAADNPLVVAKKLGLELGAEEKRTDRWNYMEVKDPRRGLVLYFTEGRLFEVWRMPAAPQTKLAPLATNAPPDRPTETVGAKQIRQMEAAIAPYVEQARRTYPAARQRYLASLPKSQNLYVVTKLRDQASQVEQVFVAVTGIKEGRITGIIASDIRAVAGYKSGDSYSFAETEMVDWLITHPDGSEEGNVVGKFLDGYQRGK